MNFIIHTSKLNRMNLFKRKVLAILLLAMLPFSSSVMAQGWTAVLDTLEGCKGVFYTDDGGLVLMGKTDEGTVSLGDDDLYLMRLDADGTQLWYHNYGGDNLEIGNEFIQTADGGYAIAGMTNSFDADTDANFYLVKVDEDGVLQYENSSIGSPFWVDRAGGLAEIPASAGGGLVSVGCYDCFGCDGCGESHQFLIAKVDQTGIANGQVIYDLSSISPAGINSEGYQIEAISSGGYMVAGVVGDANFDYPDSEYNGKFDIFLMRIDENLDSIFTKTFSFGVEDERPYSIIEDSNGDFLIAGVTRNTPDLSEDGLLIKVDVDGNELWTTTFGLPGSRTILSDILERPDGTFVINGTSTETLNGFNNYFLLNIEADGTQIGNVQTFGTNYSDDICNDMALSPTGEITLVGSQFIQNQGNPVIIALDASGVNLSNFILGKVFIDDINVDCSIDFLEQGYAGWYVTATGNNGTFHTVTETNGNYELLVAPGTYEISVTTPNSYWQPCAPNATITTTGFLDSTTLNIAYVEGLNCTDLEIDISTEFIEVAEELIYQVEFCNHGTVPALDVDVEIEMDSFFQFISSTNTNITTVGNVYTFNNGFLDIEECASFTITGIYPDVPGIAGRTHTMKAKAMPGIVCDVSPEYDNSNIQLTATCVGVDSVKIEVENIGTGVMEKPTYIIIAEDNLILRSEPIDLNPMETLPYVFESNGGTFYAESAQSEFFPYKSKPSITIEGCDSGAFSTGVVTQYSENDEMHFESIDAQENIDMIEPQSIRAYPKGLDAEHFIKPERDIEYLVYFKNETDELVKNVVIRDEIPEELDITSTRRGAASHPYKLEIVNYRILKFTLEDINLAPGEDGFLKFRISQDGCPTANTIITNKMSINFDDQFIANTNEVFHTVKVKEAIVARIDETCENETYFGNLYNVPDGTASLDTLVIDTIKYTHIDSIYLSRLTVKEVYTTSINVQVLEGEPYNGVIYLNDTYIDENYTSSLNCDSTVLVDLDVIVDTKEVLENSFRVYPNPTSGDIFLEYQLNSKTALSLEIFNSFGQEIYTQENQLPSSPGYYEVSIPSSELPPGTYMINLNTEEQRFFRKFVKLE